MWSELEISWMRLALKLAFKAQGNVEPNPMVGCVLIIDDRIIGSGHHELFGGPHAEVNAIRAADVPTIGATAFVTLEPCSHVGKTPACTDALIAAGIKRVVVATQDPFVKVAGQGIALLRAAGIEVQIGLMDEEAKVLNAPYFKRIATGMPWIIAKWAMSLDGKIATKTGESKWISGSRSRDAVHELRGRMDAIVVGIGTALADDPLLTARPPGPRVARRVVFDSQCRLSMNSRLVRTAKSIPTIVVCTNDAIKSLDAAQQAERLRNAGVDVWDLGDDRGETIRIALRQLSNDGATNILVEGGGILLGEFFANDLVDEVHCYIAPRIIGGQAAPGPVGNPGFERLNDVTRFAIYSSEMIDLDQRLILRRNRERAS